MTADVFPVTLGAVNTPLLEIVPVLADHVTPVFAVPLVLAVNCCWACDARVVLTGEIARAGEEPLRAETEMWAAIDPDSLPEGREKPPLAATSFCVSRSVEAERVKL
jgi:hypothetical protein